MNCFFFPFIVVGVIMFWMFSVCVVVCLFLLHKKKRALFVCTRELAINDWLYVNSLCCFVLYTVFCVCGFVFAIVFAWVGVWLAGMIIPVYFKSSLYEMHTKFIFFFFFIFKLILFLVQATNKFSNFNYKVSATKWNSSNFIQTSCYLNCL